MYYIFLKYIITDKYGVSLVYLPETRYVLMNSFQSRYVLICVVPDHKTDDDDLKQ